MINFLIWLVLAIILVTLWLNYRQHKVPWKSHLIDIAKFRFPPGFLWGAATSAHQVEGGCDSNDWASWENSYDEYARPRVKNGAKAGWAADHWNRYRQDLALLQQLGCNAYRFSIEWSKVSPKPGVWDQRALNHYLEKCAFLREKNITPLVTLHHFTIPLWLYEKGGFEHPDAVNYFTDYVAKVAETLGTYVDFWTTFNEPVIYAVMGWQQGLWPPGKKDLYLTAQVLYHILKAHFQAFRTIHEVDRYDADGDGISCQVGIAKSLMIFDPAHSWWLPDWLVAGIADQRMNQAVLEAFHTDSFKFYLGKMGWYKRRIPGLSETLDWFGLNYYTQILCRSDYKSESNIRQYANPRLAKTDMGWAVYPAGMYRALNRVKFYGVPLYVTENGIATQDSELRRKFILEHIDAVHEALLDKVNIRGYFYWSLMDNFEWAEGFDRRFGLYHVDYSTQQRTLKKGAEVYRDITQSNS
jgi:beta-glucosidase